MIEEMERSLATAWTSTGKPPARYVCGPGFEDRVKAEAIAVERYLPPSRSTRALFNGVPIVANPLVPDDLVVMQDAQGEILGVIRL